MEIIPYTTGDRLEGQDAPEGGTPMQTQKAGPPQPVRPRQPMATAPLRRIETPLTIPNVRPGAIYCPHCEVRLKSLRELDRHKMKMHKQLYDPQKES